MKTIVHRIRLKPGVTPERFEGWVVGSDYAAAPLLPSVAAFSVHRASAAPEAPFHYFEIIQVERLEDFERDTRTPTFAKLVEAFESMAEVVDEIAGERVDPGYQRPAR